MGSRLALLKNEVNYVLQQGRPDKGFCFYTEGRPVRPAPQKQPELTTALFEYFIFTGRTLASIQFSMDL
ncbi:hypothetical protein KKHLCK_04160 [Candidatus Electrothrix laxa]